LSNCWQDWFQHDDNNFSNFWSSFILILVDMKFNFHAIFWIYWFIFSIGIFCCIFVKGKNSKHEFCGEQHLSIVSSSNWWCHNFNLDFMINFLRMIKELSWEGIVKHQYNTNWRLKTMQPLSHNHKERELFNNQREALLRLPTW
jgi:hypothetical protein